MKRIRIIGLMLALLSFAGAEVAADSAVIVHKDNKEKVEMLDITFLLSGKKKFWNSGNEVIVAVLKDDQRVDSALRDYTGMNISRFKYHWKRLAFSGRGRLPKQFSDVKELVAFVNSNKGAIGVVGDSRNLKGVRVLNQESE